MSDSGPENLARLFNKMGQQGPQNLADALNRMTPGEAEKLGKSLRDASPEEVDRLAGSLSAGGATSPSPTPPSASPRRPAEDVTGLVRARNAFLAVGVVLSLILFAAVVVGAFTDASFSWSRFFALTGGLIVIWAMAISLGTGTAGDIPKDAPWRDLSNRQRSLVSGICFFFAALVVSPVLAIYFSWGSGPNWSACIEEFADATDLPSKSGVQLTGKVLPVWTKQKSVYRPVLRKLPEELKPAGPDEVGAIALLEWDKFQVGYYSGGVRNSEAYRKRCKVTVIDRATRTRIAEHTFLGGEPPRRVGRFGSTFGRSGSQVDDAEIARYLADLAPGRK